MTFDELQPIVQSGVISQREMLATQREIQATMQETQQIVRSNSEWRSSNAGEGTDG